MADEVFRQERKPINKEEINDSFQKVQEFQQKMGGNEGFQIKGNENNPLYRQMMAAVNKTETEETVASSPVVPKKTAQTSSGSKLADLIAGIQEKTAVYEKITLPSLGKFYDGEDGPKDGVLHIRCMTGEEEQILATPRFVKNGSAMNMIFNRCIQERFNSENFLVADRTYLLIKLRGISYSPEYEVELTCPYTEKKFNHTIDLNLDVDECPEDYDINSLTDQLPTTGFNFRYRLAVGQDEKKVQDYISRRSKFDTSSQSNDTLIYKSVMLIEEIEGLTEKEELKVLLGKLPISDVSYIRNVTSNPPFGVNTKIVVTSPYTQEDFEVDLPIETDFFFPRHRKMSKIQA